MSRLREWLHRLLHPHAETAAARARVEHDREWTEVQARRIESSTSALERRVFEENHITAAVTALLRGRRT